MRAGLRPLPCVCVCARMKSPEFRPQANPVHRVVCPVQPLRSHLPLCKITGRAPASEMLLPAVPLLLLLWPSAAQSLLLPKGHEFWAHAELSACPHLTPPSPPNPHPPPSTVQPGRTRVRGPLPSHSARAWQPGMGAGTCARCVPWLP